MQHGAPLVGSGAAGWQPPRHSCRLALLAYRTPCSWVTGWFNLLGQVAVTAGIDFTLASFLATIITLGTGGVNGEGSVGAAGWGGRGLGRTMVCVQGMDAAGLASPRPGRSFGRAVHHVGWHRWRPLARGVWRC